MAFGDADWLGLVLVVLVANAWIGAQLQREGYRRARELAHQRHVE